MKFLRKYSLFFFGLFFLVGCQFLTFQAFTTRTSDIYQQKILTTNTVHDVTRYVDKDTLVIFDIDLTLVKEYLQDQNGNPYYFQSGLYSLINKFLYKKSYEKHLRQLVAQLAKFGIARPEAEIKKIFKKYLKPFVDEKMKILWGKLEHQIDYKLMDAKIPEMIKNLQKAGNKIMCFTAREWGMKDATRKDLLKVGIDMALNTVFDKLLVQQPVGNNYGFGFDKGVLSLIRGKYFTTKTQKGRVLLNFFDEIGYAPKKVVFIDNRMDNVQEVVEAMNKKGIPVSGLWYKFDGYIEKPVLQERDVQILNRYFGQNWWDIQVDLQKALGFVKENLGEKSRMGSQQSLLVLNS